jgi:hypothetical protein
MLDLLKPLHGEKMDRCMKNFSAPVFMLVLVASSTGAWAHSPVVIDGGPTDSSTAYPIEDYDHSQIGYHNATAEAPELWYAFEANEGDGLFVQLGVPVIDGLEDLRPVAALLAPGLPEVDVPFPLPEGYGGILFTTDGQTPIEYDEEFTGTFSWRFPDIEETFTESGTYYLVGYLPEGQTGKFWMALGEREEYGLEDLFTLPTALIQTRTFHEVFPLGGLLFWFYLLFLIIVFGLGSLLSSFIG